MGWFAAFGDRPDGWKQLLATSVKLPALFLLTLAITFPSLYVFNAPSALGSRSVPRCLLVAAVVVNLAVAASLGPILAFFTLSTTSYAFMIVLNVVLLGISGFIGLRFLLRALRALSVARFAESHVEATDTPEHETEAPNAAGDADTESTGSAEPRTPGSVCAERLAATKRDTPIRPQQDSSINAVFVIWIMLYGIVGCRWAGFFGRSSEIPNCRLRRSASVRATSCRDCCARSSSWRADEHTRA